MLMRRTRRRRPLIRRRRKSRIMMPKSMVPETKYHTLIDVAKSIKNNFFTTQTGTLAGMNNYYPDIFSNIVKGTDDNQRVGDRIFVKFISMQFFIQGCVDLISGDQVFNFLVRILVHNSRIAAGTDIAGFFRGISISPITHLKPDRRNVSIWHDKMHLFRCNSAFNAGTRGAGDLKVIRIKIPVYRNIGYDSLGNTKDDNSTYSMSAAAYNMAGAAQTFKQVACMDVCIRTYFTDS